MILVVDASVALKWFFREREDENHGEQALAILTGIDSGRIQMAQPPHFLAEVAAVLAREKPRDGQADLIELQNIEWQLLDEPAVYLSAMTLAIRLQCHLFDTLYHATALHMSGSTLVTANRRYYENAREYGQITLLCDFKQP